MLRTNLDSLCLQHLAHIQETGEILRLGVVLGNVVMNDGVAFVVLLVHQHHRRKDSGAVLGFSKALHRAPLRERLEAVFGDEPPVMLLVVRERHAAVPHAPVVHVASLVGIGDGLVIGTPRARPVGRLRVEPRYDPRQNAAELGQVVLPHLKSDFSRKLVPAVPSHRGLSLVVAAPQRDAGVVAQAAHLVLGLSFNVLFEGIRTRLPIVPKHEVLPHHQAKLVADRKELVCFVVAAAPVPNHVHICVARRLQNAPVVSRRHAVGKAIERNHVRALGENRNPIDNQFKRPAPLVQFAIQHNRSQPGLGLSLLSRLASNAYLRCEFILRLSAVASRIPELGLANFYRNVDHITPGMESRFAGQSDRFAIIGIQHTDLRRSCAGRLDLDFRIDVRHFFGHVALADGEVGDADLVPRLKAHRAPDAARDKRRTPIPSIFIGGLANVGLGCGLGLRLPRVCRGHRFRSIVRGWKHHTKRILADVQFAFHRYAPDAEHVVRGKNPGAIHINL